MMLSKISRGVGTLPKNLLSKEIVLANGYQLSKRDFSIAEIGKRYEKPYDYKKKQYGILGQIFDSTMRKLGENSLIITVEGNFGSGKSSFAQKLAKEIDFVYAREPDFENHLFRLPNGNNLRDIINGYVGDHKLYHVDSIEDWHLNPTFKGGIQVQHGFYFIRWMQLRTALLHLMSTGQGVVLERSAFSDSVIGQALYENNLLSDAAYRFYIRDLIPSTLHELWRPHLSIYLDKSPEECLKTIKESGKPFEKNSKVYTLDLLRSVEKNYKKEFLPDMKNNLHVLTYKSNEVNIERTIEDMELLNFDDESKFMDWRCRKETTLNIYRKTLADHYSCINLLKAPNSYIDVPEYLWYGEEFEKLLVKLGDDDRYTGEVKETRLFAPLAKSTGEREWL